jgi:hypothetical protein
MPEFQALKAMLLSADTAMAAVTFFFVCFVVTPLLPSPLPSDPSQKPDRWKVVKELKWVPLASAFVMGTFLSVWLDPDKNELIVSKVRSGLQTGAYSCALWETYSKAIKPVIDKILGGESKG